MCGISGVYGYRRAIDLESERLAAIAELIRHRGPDDHGTFVDGSLGFGFRRLSIIDVGGGHQPIIDHDSGCAIEFNGEIYNFRELRRELTDRGHRFETESDTEVILRGYLEWGTGVLDRLNGIFGFAVWDPRSERLLLARDHFGIKPLYYADDGELLRFGSEMRTILNDNHVPERPVKRVLDPDAVRLLLHFGYLPSPHTLIAGVRKLGPGEMLTCDPHGVTVTRYANDVVDTDHEISIEDAVERYTELFEAAVTRQMVADVEVGCLLSGGVDSGMVLAAATERSDGPLATFTVSFGDDFDHDEAADAAETARHFGSNHHDLRIEVDDVEQLLIECLWHLEEPVLSQSTFAYHLMNREVSKQVKVVLTGQGADEPWAGYDRYIGERYGGKARWLFRSSAANAVASAVPGAERFRRATASLGIDDPAVRFAAIHQVFDPATIDALAGPGLAGATADPIDVIRRLQQPVAHLDEFTQLLHIDTRLSLADDLLLYGDKLSMSSSVEARVPFLDRELMAFVESLPPAMKLRGRTAKYVHKRAAEHFLPKEFVHRPKRGFATPIDAWFADELVPLLDRTVLAPDSVCTDMLDRSTIVDLVEQHQAGSRNHRRQLTTLVSLEIVASQLLETASDKSVPFPPAKESRS